VNSETGKFKNVPEDSDQETRLRLEVKLGEYDVLYEVWNWDGIQGESIIFANEDLGDMEDCEIEQLVRSTPICKDGTSITLKRSQSGFTFVNFNFET